MGRKVGAARIAGIGTSIFTEITALAVEHGAANLGQGFPDFPAPDFVKEAAARHIREDHNQYAASAGLPRLRRALADDYRRRWPQGPIVDPDAEVTVASGATELLHDAVLARHRPGGRGDRVRAGLRRLRAGRGDGGRNGSGVPLTPPDWRFDPARLEAAVGPRTRALILNSPHNPTGKAFRRQELEAIAAVCLRHDLLVIADEVYSEIVFGAPPPVGRHVARDVRTDDHHRQHGQDLQRDRLEGRLGDRAAVAHGRAARRPSVRHLHQRDAVSGGAGRRAAHRRPRRLLRRASAPTMPAAATPWRRRSGQRSSTRCPSMERTSFSPTFVGVGSPTTWRFAGASSPRSAWPPFPRPCSMPIPPPPRRSCGSASPRATRRSARPPRVWPPDDCRRHECRADRRRAPACTRAAPVGFRRCVRSGAISAFYDWPVDGSAHRAAVAAGVAGRHLPGQCLSGRTLPFTIPLSRTTWLGLPVAPAFRRAQPDAPTCTATAAIRASGSSASTPPAAGRRRRAAAVITCRTSMRECRWSSPTARRSNFGRGASPPGCPPSSPGAIARRVRRRRPRWAPSSSSVAERLISSTPGTAAGSRRRASTTRRTRCSPVPPSMCASR